VDLDRQGLAGLHFDVAHGTVEIDDSAARLEGGKLDVFENPMGNNVIVEPDPNRERDLPPYQCRIARVRQLQSLCYNTEPTYVNWYSYIDLPLCGICGHGCADGFNSRSGIIDRLPQQRMAARHAIDSALTDRFAVEPRPLPSRSHFSLV
jgi:hypothetical protein